MGVYDLILHVEAPSDGALSKWALSARILGIGTKTVQRVKAEMAATA